MVVITSNAMEDFDQADTWGGWHYAWIACLVVKTIYCYVWDITMDWALWRCQKPGFSFPKGLRQKRLYSWTWVYYFAMVTNFFMRCSWAIAISVNNLVPPYWSMLMAAVEIFRRAQWLVFRIENESIKQTKALVIRSHYQHESSVFQQQQGGALLQQESINPNTNISTSSSIFSSSSQTDSSSDDIFPSTEPQQIDWLGGENNTSLLPFPSSNHQIDESVPLLTAEPTQGRILSRASVTSMHQHSNPSFTQQI
eukprot:CAMPEP_0201545094 /NCGR_PEP_ID=MMETSP0173_2-20130828/1643_1 /ASSEMBLY_ACC=CAM_ASM_000268 /TAXON_ID=218659 /ORGANISM="Vexillifera sp., Strain DIVA3 564/2" /LENGTH=252 /DNA_ID=CAMNT_0047953403 /DNA_START=434 /DNA_END=1192 /DNA_ORIENTATION=-